jgi:hypothetical protein
VIYWLTLYQYDSFYVVVKFEILIAVIQTLFAPRSGRSRIENCAIPVPELNK